MPCQGPLHFSHIAVYHQFMSLEFCSVSDPDVGPSVLVCDVEHTSVNFGLDASTFVLCLLVECPRLCTMRHRSNSSWTHVSSCR